MKFLEHVGIKIIELFAIVILGLLTVVNVICMVNISYDYGENVSYSLNWIGIIVFPIFIIIFLALLSKFEKLNPKMLFLVGSVLYGVAFGYVLWNTEHVLRADAWSVFESARGIAAGNYSSLRTTGYLGYYPHQLGLAVYDLLLGMIGKSEKVLFVANFIEVLLINWFGYKITQIYFQDEQVSRLLMVLEFAFLPQMFFTMFGYGLIPGFCCMIIALYQVVCITRKKSHSGVRAVAAIVFMALAVLLKKNYIIGAAAIAIALFLQFLQKGQWRTMLLSALVLCVPFLCPTLLRNGISSVTGASSYYSVPSIARIAMGTDLHNEDMGPGWYDRSFEKTYTKIVGYDAEKATELGAQKLKKNIEETIHNPAKAIKFYGKKILSTWCDPLFQSVWSGPVESMGATVNSKLLLSLSYGGKVEWLIRVPMKCFVIIIFASALLFLFKHGDRIMTLAVPYLYLIGGFLFHLIWETKSQYVYTYVFLLLPICAYEINALVEWHKQRKVQ